MVKGIKKRKYSIKIIISINYGTLDFLLLLGGYIFYEKVMWEEGLSISLF